jgi:hypothetical protein
MGRKMVKALVCKDLMEARLDQIREQKKQKKCLTCFFY